MFFRLAACLSLYVIFVIGDDCTPHHTIFHWTSPCHGQPFSNVFTFKNVSLSQNDQPSNIYVGIDPTKELDIVMTYESDYDRTIVNPLLDLSLHKYSRVFGKCQWSAVKTFIATKNLNTCDFMNNCYMDSGTETQLTLRVNFAEIAQGFMELIDIGTYGSFWITFKDGEDNKLACINFQVRLANIVSTKQKRSFSLSKIKVPDVKMPDGETVIKMAKLVQCLSEIKSLKLNRSCILNILSASAKCYPCGKNIYDCVNGTASKMTSCAKENFDECENCCTEVVQAFNACPNEKNEEPDNDGNTGKSECECEREKNLNSSGEGDENNGNEKMLANYFVMIAAAFFYSIRLMCLSD